VKAEEIAVALAASRPFPGRLMVRPGRQGSVVIDDSYNSSPAAAEAALRVLLSEPGRTRIAVLGDMLELGDHAAAAHREVGRAAAQVDRLVALGEYGVEVLAGARMGGMAPERMQLVDSSEAAVRAVGPYLEGAVVLVKASRGMALERVVEQLLEESG
jgi:UDP-N-acetylmuramoyl-tripeptide--D-alanyl-D-alanine ligase